MNDSLNDEKKLIADTKADISNFNQLYEKYAKAVFRYSYNRIGRRKELAEDITSETFVKAIEKFDRYEFRNKPFVVWLYTIAHNLIVDYYRKNKKGQVSLDSLPIEPSEEDEAIIDKLSKEEMKDRVNGKVSDLSEELNHIFTLRHTEDLTFAEIGKLVGKSEGAVKMQYYRGLELLKSIVVKND